MHWFPFTIVALTAPQAFAVTVLRFGCSQITIERLDPLVNPGVNPSPHVHQIVGGNAFNASIPTTDVAALAGCTSCTFSEDFSNYWTANMYFKARNGTFKRVPQIPNSGVGATAGGITVYYINDGSTGAKATAFKPGFRMLVGDQSLRTATGQDPGICLRCYSGPNFGGDTAAPCAGNLDTKGFPTKPCLGGMRSNLHFPTCWDGVNLDSPNHKDHVAFSKEGGGATGGPVTCPSTHPVRLPQVMLEVVWDTTSFNNKADWPTDGSQPFYWSMGDNTGYGQHADYVFGWQNNSLQNAIDANSCFGNTCKALKTQVVNTMNACTVKTTVQEDVDGWLTSLPGGEGM